eukprot:Nitzschia sp. Nitz4//scaffold18_size181773//62632//63963//NITZ4_001912-RA/size181773-processed-gene-0.12-mRNA-1//1//CDS//3329540002//5655//frame0
MKSLPSTAPETPGSLERRVGATGAVVFVVLALLETIYMTMATPWSSDIPTAIQHTKSLQESGWINTSTVTASNVTTHQLPVMDTPSTTTTANATSSIPGNSDVSGVDIPPTLFQTLGGELGNHLGYLMHGFAVKWYAQETLGIDFNLISLHQPHPKWTKGRNEMLQCFPKFKDWNFDRDQSWAPLEERKQQQNEWLPQARQDVLKHVDDDPTKGTAFNDSLMAYLEEYQRLDKPHGLQGSDISLPYLSTSSYISSFFLDRYFDRIRELLEFDTSTKSRCCAILPDEDETVFHYRNFVSEIPSGAYGLVDFGPNQTARDLFGHLQPGDKVVMITRTKNAKADAQMDALRARGLQVRLITNQSGVQDFCILLKAKKEVIGLALSTFAFWGSLLGSAQKIHLYVPLGPQILSQYKSEENVRQNVLYNYTHSGIRERLTISLIPLKE